MALADEPECDGEAGDSSRLCAVTREVRPREELIRFVADPQGNVVPDIRCKLPGRGVWVGCSRETVAAALRGGAFARGLKRPVKADPGLAEAVEAILVRSTLDRLSLANKAGEVLLGFEKISASIGAGEPLMGLVHASDAAEGGSVKLDRKFSARMGLDAAPPILLFDSAQLSLALGRSNVIHAALKPGGASRKFVEDVQRLRRYRTAAGS